MSGFVHLHCHSTWSLLDGAITAEELPELAARRGFEAIALTDHDSLLGAVRFTRAARKAGIKPLYGAELTLEQEQRGAGSAGPQESHVTLLARNATGYGNLCRLISKAHLTNQRGSPRIDYADLVERAEGLFVLSGCERGPIARLAASGRVEKAIELARRWRSDLGGDFRIEVFDHRSYGHRALRDRLLGVAKNSGVPAVATNDVHYSSPSGAATHEVLHAIKHIVPLSRTQALRSTSEYYLKDPDEMRELFFDASEAADETMAIAEACDFELDLDNYYFPEFSIPDGETPNGGLTRRCYEGAARRFDRITPEVSERLEHELQMIFKLGFASFFLLVADIVDHVRKNMGIRCACRGSATGSLVCFVLGISDVDPIRYDLLFERFVNTRREELPDVDVDVESHRREEVLDYIAKAYGAEQTAICCMVDTFRARMAIREVGKALGIAPDEIDLVAKAFPRIRARAIPEAIASLPELRDGNLQAGQLELLFELCYGIDGFPRHLALHPSGVILSSPDLADRVPMQESFEGFTMLQADKDDVEDLGLVKLDVLGVRMLSSIAHARDQIARTRSQPVDLDSLPRDDRSTFELIASSRTLGCFQIESPGQRELLARYQPNRFEDLIVDISLFRPGPVKSDMVSPFLDRRHGFEETVYPHDNLEPILRETNGVIVFHEQVIRVIAAVTGCSLDDADYIRRHLDSERPSLPDDPNSRPIRKGLDGPRSGVSEDNEVGDWFIDRAIGNGYTPAQAAKLWREVFAFASFGFCKSHAAAFALPTYISAYLKAHYAPEFLAGVLTHDPGMYPRRLIVADARHFDIAILPIDVNASFEDYRVEAVDRKWGIRLSLSEVKGISAAEVDSLLDERRAHRFTSLEDLWRRVELSRPVLENLIHIGALDSIEPRRSRRALLWRAAELSGEPRPVPGAQLGLAFDDPVSIGPQNQSGYTELEQVTAELAVTGIDARRHLMSLYRPLLRELHVTPGVDLRAMRSDAEVWVAGVKVSTQTPAIRSGQRIIFLTLDDISGPVDVTLFERWQARCARTVFHSWLLLVRGVVRKRGGASLIHDMHPTNVGVTVVAHEAFDLAQLAADRKECSLASALGRQRKRQATTGLAPVSAELGAHAKLWHSSGGSAGR
ncbi:MAG: DNA polymerase III subunit alpha [Actinomycetota bacterium]|nr:DNA polymerase III subunit alpha [Actinomycetota bacterium]